jgi:hypothetical protein
MAMKILTRKVCVDMREGRTVGSVRARKIGQNEKHLAAADSADVLIRDS